MPFQIWRKRESADRMVKPGETILTFSKVGGYEVRTNRPCPISGVPWEGCIAPWDYWQFLPKPPCKVEDVYEGPEVEKP